MASDVITRIRALQAKIDAPDHAEPPPHQPELLLIGCIDARLNIDSDIGIPYGKALIYRNIAALISGADEAEDIACPHLGEAAALEFAVNVMKVKDIVVMGHTDCGGIQACLHGIPGTEHIMRYLNPLNELREKIITHNHQAITKELTRNMERGAVRQSLANLMTYSSVAAAVKEGRLGLHGWVIDTATRRIAEMDRSSKQFHFMR